MKPYDHAVSSANKFGGAAEDYLEIHNFMDSSKAHIADGRHRAILHSSFGIFITERVFGVVIENSAGKKISVRDIGEQHVLEDLGTIPTVADWLKDLPIASWMGNKEPKSLETSPVALLADLNKSLREKSKELMEPFIKDLESKLVQFLNESDIDGICWVQYTPGFNDGEPCEFGVHEVSYCRKLTSEDLSKDGTGLNDLEDVYIDHSDCNGDSEGFECSDNYYVSIDYKDPKRKIEFPEDLKEAFELEDVFCAAFGNGAKVFISKDEGKLHSEEYDCGY